MFSAISLLPFLLLFFIISSIVPVWMRMIFFSEGTMGKRILIMIPSCPVKFKLSFAVLLTRKRQNLQLGKYRSLLVAA